VLLERYWVLCHTEVMVRLELLGGAVLVVRGMRHILERKTAGVLAYLAQAGSQPRSILAGLLWANTTEDSARNNLRQCLFRLKKLGNLVSGEQFLELSGLEVDVLYLEQQALLGEYAPWTFARGELLAGYHFDDCPDFEEWLRHTRMRLSAAQNSAFANLHKHSPAALQLEVAERWLEVMPLEQQALKAVVEAQVAVSQLEAAKRSVANFQERHQREYGSELPHLWQWLEQQPQSAQDLVAAAKTAQDNLHNAEAARLYLQAADAFAAQKDVSEECDALQEALDLMDTFDRSQRVDAILDRVSGVARSPQQILRWRFSQAVVAHQRSQWQTALHHLEQVHKLAERQNNRAIQMNAFGYLADCHVQLGQLEEAAVVFEMVVQKSKSGNDPEEICVALINLAYLRGLQEQPQTSVKLLREALEVAESANQVVHQLAILNQLTFYLCREHLFDALEYSKRALALQRHISGQDYELARSHKFFGDLQANLGQYPEALLAYQTALELTEKANLPNSYLYRSKAVVLTTLGDFAAAQTALEAGFAKTNKDRSDVVALTSTQLYLWRMRGEASLQKLESLLVGWSPAQIQELDRFELEPGFLLHGQERIEYVQQNMRQNTSFGDYFLAAAYLAHQQPELALPLTKVLYQRLQNHQCGIYPATIMLCHADVLAALNEPQATVVLEQAKHWVLDKASRLENNAKRLFLEQNPVNRRLLQPVLV
jgi:DNA-binding SARP family transcriptional activator